MRVSVIQFLCESKVEFNRYMVSYITGCADTLCNIKRIDIDKIDNGRFGIVPLYPKGILEEVFKQIV